MKYRVTLNDSIDLLIVADSELEAVQKAKQVKDAMHGFNEDPKSEKEAEDYIENITSGAGSEEQATNALKRLSNSTNKYVASLAKKYLGDAGWFNVEYWEIDSLGDLTLANLVRICKKAIGNASVKRIERGKVGSNGTILTLQVYLKSSLSGDFTWMELPIYVRPTFEFSKSLRRGSDYAYEKAISEIKKKLKLFENKLIYEDKSLVADSIIVSDESESEKVRKAQEWVDYDIKHYGEVSEQTKKDIAAAGLSFDKWNNQVHDAIYPNIAIARIDIARDFIQKGDYKRAISALEDAVAFLKG